MIAERAICRPKLDETFCDRRARSRPKRVLEVARELVLLGRRQRLHPHLEVLVLVAADGLAAALDDGVAWPMLARLGARTSVERDGLRRLERDLRAALEVDAEVQALDAERTDRDRDDRAGDREPEVAAAHEVDLQPLAACWPCAPMKRGFSNQRKPASRPSIARVAATAVTSEITVPISSISAKPLTPAVATANRTSAVITVTTFASMIVWKPFEYPAAIAARTDFPDAHLFLDALEDDDVRVGRDTDRQDQAGEARQRQRDVEEQDRRVEEAPRRCARPSTATRPRKR